MTEKRRNRPPPISYHPPKDLREEFFARHERSGLSMNEFITRSVFGPHAPRAARRQPIERKEIVRLQTEMVKLRALFEQALERDPDNPELLHHFKRACDDQAVFVTAFLDALGRRQ